MLVVVFGVICRFDRQLAKLILEFATMFQPETN